MNKRYDFYIEYGLLIEEEAADGDWCKASDVDQLEQERDELKKRLLNAYALKDYEHQCAEHNRKEKHRLQQERDQLAARVDRLESGLLIAEDALLALDKHTHPQIECDAAAQSCYDALNKSQAQSLAAHNREMLLKLADEAFNDTGLIYFARRIVDQWLRAKAAEMEGE